MASKFRKVFALFFLQYILIDAIPNIVFLNNKPMTYDSQGELVELIASSEPSREQVHEKSNLYKKSDFVTKSKFTHNGLLTKHNFTRKEPPKNSKFSFDHSNDFPNYSVIHSLFKDPGYIQTAVVFDDVTNQAIDTTYDIIRKPEKFETTKQRPTVAFYTTTPAPTSIIPIIVTQQSSNKKSNKKTKTKKTPPKPVTSDIHDHIMKNLEYYKKLLSVNCTLKGNESKNEEYETIEITPRPMKIAINDKDIQSAEKDKSKKKCDCKHQHHHGHHHEHGHHHHKHSHEKHSHENYKPSGVVLHQPSTIQPVYVQSHKLPEYQTHIHHHQSSKGNNGIGVADNAALFGSTGESPSLRG
jgi:hypothetical protein